MRAIVVGAGITGVAAAEWMRRDGHEVTLVDRIRPGDPRQTSYGNAGILARGAVVPLSEPGVWKKALKMAFSPDEPLFVRLGYLPQFLPWGMRFVAQGARERVERSADALAGLVLDAVEQHEALSADTGAARFITRGPYVMLYRSRAAFAKDAGGFALRRRHGVGWEEWDRDRIDREDPEISRDYAFAAALTDHAWIGDPGGYVAALARHYEAAGGRFVERAVTDIEPGESGARVHLEGGGTLDGECVVLAAGVWARAMARKLGWETDVEAERGYHVHLAGASHRPPFPIMVSDAKTVATPMEGGMRFAGVAEFAGIDAPEAKAPVDLIRRTVHRLYPGLTWENAETWMGRRPSTPDSLPMLGRAPGAPGVVFAFGGQHLGLTMGPRLGRMAAGIAAGRAPNADIAALAPERFGRAP